MADRQEYTEAASLPRAVGIAEAGEKLCLRSNVSLRIRQASGVRCVQTADRGRHEVRVEEEGELASHGVSTRRGGVAFTLLALLNASKAREKLD